MALFTRLPFYFSGSAYTPPTSLSADFTPDLLQFVQPYSWDSFEYGDLSTRLKTLGAWPNGLDASSFGTTRIAYNKQYVYPVGLFRPNILSPTVLNGRTVTVPSIGDSLLVNRPREVYTSFYRPASGDSLYFILSAAYTSPLGSYIQFEQTAKDTFRTYRFYGEDSLSVGGGNFVAFRVRSYSIPTLGDLLQFSGALNAIDNRRRVAIPGGFQDSFFNIYTYIRNKSQIIYAVGNADSVVGEPIYAGDSRQEVELNNKGFSATLWGVQFVSNQYRYVNVVPGKLSLSFSTTHVIGYARRYIYSVAIKSLDFGRAEIAPPKIVSFSVWTSSYVSTNVSIENVVIKPVGFDSLTIGPSEYSYEITRIYCYNTHVRDILSIQAMEIGSVDIHNWQRYIVCFEDIYWFYYTNRGVGQFGKIENKTKEIAPWGLDASWVSWYTNLRNGARNVYPLSVDPPTYDSVWVAGNYTRYIFTIWYAPSSQVRMWHRIDNTAWALKPRGFSALQSGVEHKFEFYKRYLTARFIYDSLAFGSTVTGYTPRAFQVYSYNSSSFVYSPWISLGAQQVYPIGFSGATRPSMLSEPVQLGYPTLIGPFHLELKPRWAGDGSSFVAGPTRVRNITPELRPSQEIVGAVGQTPWISFRVRPLLVKPIIDGFVNLSTTIRDRRQYVVLLGYGKNYLYVPITTKVELGDPTLAVPLYVAPYGIDTLEMPNGLGDGPPYVYGTPSCKGFDASAFGTNFVRGNGIFPKSIQSPFFMTQRKPCVVSGVQYISFRPTTPVELVRWTIFTEVLADTQTVYPYHVVNPYTIYCTNDPAIVTDQVITNAGLTDSAKFWRSDFDIMSPEISGSVPGEATGYPYYSPLKHDISLKNRAVYPAVFSTLTYVGKPRVVSTLIYVIPKGVYVGKFSFSTEVWPYEHNVIIKGFEVVPEFGELVALWDHKITQYVRPSLFFSYFGKQLVQNWIQDVYPSGVEGLQLMEYVFSPPMVHFPRILEPEYFGYEYDAFGGKTFIDFRIRSLAIDGLDSLSMESDEDFIHDFLSIRITAFRPQVMSVLDEYFGRPRTANVYQYIGAYGIQGSRCLGRTSVSA